MAEKIQVEIVGKSSSLEAAMARASGSVKEHVGQIQGSLQGAKDGIDRVGASLSTAFELTGLAVAAAAVGMISQKLIAMGERAIEIRNMSAVLQVTGLQFQAMGEAAEEAGIGTSKLFSATEKLVQLLAEARAGSHAAMDTLFAMGVTLGQIQDPGFGTADMLAHLSSRLNNSATATSTMLALTKEFGGRAALAAQAIKALASDTADWHIEADKINALSDEQTKHLQKMGLEWKDMGQYIENATAKLLVWIDTHPVLTMSADWLGIPDYGASAPPTPIMKRHGGESAAKAGDADAAFAETKATMESIKDQLEAVKDGSAQKLALLKAYAAAALEYYGSGEVDAVKAANRAVIAEQRRFAEEQDRLKKEAATKAASAAERLQQLELRVAQLKTQAAHALIADAGKILDEQVRLEQEASDKRREMGLEDVAFAEQELEAMAQVGLISRQQELDGLRDLEIAKFKIAAQALQERIALMQTDEVAQVKARAQLELLEMAHVRKLRAIDLQAMGERMSTWKTMAQGMGNAMQPVIAGFLNMTTGLKGLFQGMAAAIGDTMAQMAARNIATMLSEAAVGKAIRLKEIGGSAAAAAGAAYKAVVGIPYIGPILAPAAAGVAFTAVMAYKSMASAKGGYDIPAGTNPVTQLHAQEMVLPAEHAETIRGMRGRGGGTTIHNHINAMDSRSVVRALSAGGALDKALKGVMRRRGFNE